MGYVISIPKGERPDWKAAARKLAAQSDQPIAEACESVMTDDDFGPKVRVTAAGAAKARAQIAADLDLVRRAWSEKGGERRTNRSGSRLVVPSDEDGESGESDLYDALEHLGDALALKAAGFDWERQD